MNSDETCTVAASRLGIRHFRAMILTYRINRHYDAYSKLGMLPVNADKDFAIVDRIRKGEL